MTGAITFNSNDLQTYDNSTRLGILTNSIEHTDIPDRDVALLQIANASLSVIPQTSYPSRKVRIAGAINGSSQSDLDSRIDTFKSYFTGKDKNLDIEYGGATRRYVATANTVAVQRMHKALYAEFTIEFVCSLPFGKATVAITALTASGRTSAGYTDAYTFIGNAPFQMPVITITYSAISGGSSFVSFGNNTNGQGITITDQTFVAGDVLEIDVSAKTVKKNGVEIDSLGAYPEFEPGAQSFSYSDGFTTRTFAITVTYYPMYL